MSDNFPLIKLNVGGQTFITYFEPLKVSAYFEKLGQNISQPDSYRISNEGNVLYYFIDRDPDVFEDIMHYLRTWEIRSKDKAYLKILRNEAKFFEFNDLVKRLDQILTDSIISDEILNDTYQSKELNYLSVGYNTEIFDSSPNETLVQAYRHNWYKEESESRVVIKDSTANRQQH